MTLARGILSHGWPYWWSNDKMSQAMKSHDIDLILPKYLNEDLDLVLREYSDLSSTGRAKRVLFDFF